MAEEDVSQISAGEFEAVSQLLASSESLQLAFIIMVAGIIAIVAAYRAFSSWIRAKKTYYAFPHKSKFLRSAILPLFAIALITSTNAYIQSSDLFEEEHRIAHSDMTAEEMFAKILNTFNILVIGYTAAQLVPIVLIKRDRSGLEKEDFDAWFESRGFSDDEGDLFHRLYRWVPPKSTPEDMEDADFQKRMETEEGRLLLEHFRTGRGNPIGGYEKLVKNPFEAWKKSEREKYEKYFDSCVTGDNQSGRKLNPGVKPEEIYPIDVWREEKRAGGFEPIVAGSRPPGYAKKKREGIPKSAKQALPIGIFIATILGVVAWWGVDLFVVATATGGFAIGLGLALQETMQNYFAYLFIKKDKIFSEGDRIQLESGYNGYVHKITPRVTYVMNAQYESVAVVPTRSLTASQIINYTKENRLVPAVVGVGVSYLNDPRQVEAILVKIGERGMRELTNERKEHLVRQKKCPYLKRNRPSCGCDKDLLVNISQPIVRFQSFNASSLDFTVTLFVRDYGSQFRTKSVMRMMIYEEFKRYDIRIPWDIRTVYQGDEQKEGEEIARKDPERKKVVEEYGSESYGHGEFED